jgi:hypothetical protein
LGRAAFCEVRLEYFELFSINIDHEEAVVLGATDDIHRLAHRNGDGGLMIVLVPKNYGRPLCAVMHPDQLRRGTLARP